MATNLIHYASIGKTGKLIHLICTEGISVDAKNKDGETALFHAAKFGKKSTVKALLKLGANPNTPNRDGITPVIAAAFEEETACLDLLLESGGTWFCENDDHFLLDKMETLMCVADGYHESILHCTPDEVLVVGEVPSSSANPNKGMFGVHSCRAFGTKMTAKIRKKWEGASENGLLDLMLHDLDRLRALRHPNIAQPFVIAHFSDGSRAALLTEQSGHGSLYRVLYVTKTQIPSPSKPKIILQLLQACIFLHECGILHNFINSSSINITDKWNVKLSNFEYSGLKYVELLPADKQFHLRYTSPETIACNHVSRVSDVFSLGIVTWELISGQQPWSWLDDSEVILLAKQTKNNRRLPVMSGWPPYAKRIIDEATRRQPYDRKSFRELLNSNNDDLLISACLSPRSERKRSTKVVGDSPDRNDEDDEDDNENEKRSKEAPPNKQRTTRTSPLNIPQHVTDCPYESSYPRASLILSDDPNNSPSLYEMEVVTSVIPGAEELDNRLESVVSEYLRDGETEESIVNKVKDLFKRIQANSEEKEKPVSGRIRAPLPRTNAFDDTIPKKQKDNKVKPAPRASLPQNDPLADTNPFINAGDERRRARLRRDHAFDNPDNESRDARHGISDAATRRKKWAKEIFVSGGIDGGEKFKDLL